jgi:PAS domain S-box-containing protein
MLSARAGEESRVEGLQAGADDYLVKPFSSRDLLARVSTHLQMARLRREADQAIRQSEERFRVLFETMSEGFAIDEILLDDAGRVHDLRHLEVNSAFERHTGLQRARVVGRTLREQFPDLEPLWFERYGEVVRSGAPAHFQAKFGPLQRWFEVSVYRIAPRQAATVFFDITEQRRAEERERQLLTEAATRHGTGRHPPRAEPALPGGVRLYPRAGRRQTILGVSLVGPVARPSRAHQGRLRHGGGRRDLPRGNAVFCGGRHGASG